MKKYTTVPGTFDLWGDLTQAETLYCGTAAIKKNDCMLAQQYVDTTSGVAHHRAFPEGERDFGADRPMNSWVA